MSGGGGRRYFLSDINSDLIDTYQVIKRDPEPLIHQLRAHASNHSSDYYYQIRGQHELDDPIEIAARFIYLNKTCYNGLWRVNSRGEFNVPVGSAKSPAICQPELLRACHTSLRDVELCVQEFIEVEAGECDFIYFDPPYHPLSETSSFTTYATGGFSEGDQTALRDFCFALHKRGAKVMLSNSDTRFIRDLYTNSIFRVEQVQAPRMVNRMADRRGAVNELLIRNYGQTADAKKE